MLRRSLVTLALVGGLATSFGFTPLSGAQAAAKKPSSGLPVCRGFQPETISAAKIACTLKADVILKVKRRQERRRPKA